MAKSLIVDNLTVTFSGSDFRFHPASFSMEEGEIVAVVGESGSGKSTLGKALLHLNDKDATVTGKVIINGKDIYQISEKELKEMRMTEFSMAFQNSRELFHPLLTVESQLYEVLKKRYSKKEAKERMIELMEFVGLEQSVLHKLPKELSGGMLQRLLILSAIALHPKFVILDEPTSALDVKTQERILELIRKINREFGISFLIITHDFRVAQQLSHRMLIFYQGHLVEEGHTEEILELPLHPYSRGLIQSSMDLNPYKDIWGIRNVVDGRVKRSDGCPFYERCHQCLPQCKDHLPPLIPHKTVPNRKIACNRNGIITILEGENLSKRFGSHQIFTDLHLTVRSAEVVSLVGKSGCGKSTLANILSGFLKPDSGTVLFDSKPADFDQLHRIKGGIQIVFQDPDQAINPSFTVEQAITEPLFLMDKKQSYTETARSLLADVGLPTDEGFFPQRIRLLSGGQKQRILLARALSMEPRLLIADEVTSMLDASSKANLVRLLKEIQNKRGLSMLFVTHDLTCAQKISDQILLMDGKGNLTRQRENPAPSISL